MKKYRVTAIPPELPKAQKGLSKKKKKSKADNVSDTTPNVRETISLEDWLKDNSPKAFGLTSFEMPLSKEFLENSYFRNLEMGANYNHALNIIANRKAELADKEEYRRQEDWYKSLDASKKHDKIEPFHVWSKIKWQKIQEEAEAVGKNLYENWYIQEEPDGSAKFWPKGALLDKAKWNGLREEDFEEDWGLDRKQVVDQIGSEMDYLDKRYAQRVKNKIFKDVIDQSLEQGKTIDEIVDQFPESGNWGYKETIRKRYGDDVAEVVDEVFKLQAEALIPEKTRGLYESPTIQGFDWGSLNFGKTVRQREQEEAIKKLEEDYKNNRISEWEYLSEKSKLQFSSLPYRPNLDEESAWSYKGGEDEDPKELMNAYYDWWIENGDENNPGKTQADIDKRKKLILEIKNKSYDDVAKKAGEEYDSKQKLLQEMDQRRKESSEEEEEIIENNYDFVQPQVSDTFSHYEDEKKEKQSIRNYLSEHSKSNDRAEAIKQAVNLARNDDFDKLTGVRKDFQNYQLNQNEYQIIQTMEDAINNPNLTEADRTHFLSLYNDKLKQLEEHPDYYVNPDDPFDLRGENSLYQILNKYIYPDAEQDLLGFDKENPTFKDQLDYLMGLENLYNTRSFMKEIEEQMGTMRSFDPEDYKEPSIGSKIWDVSTNPFAAAQYALDPVHGMWDGIPSNLSYNEAQEYEDKYGIDLGTLKDVTPFTFLNSVANIFNPADWIDQAYRGYQDKGWTGVGGRLSDKFWDLASVALTGGIPAGQASKIGMELLNLTNKADKIRRAYNAASIPGKVWQGGKLAANTLGRAGLNFANNTKLGQYGYRYLTQPATTAAFAFDSVRPGGYLHTGFNELGEGNYLSGLSDVGMGTLGVLPAMKAVNQLPRFLEYTTPSGKTFGLGSNQPNVFKTRSAQEWKNLHNASVSQGLKDLGYTESELAAAEESIASGEALPEYVYSYRHPKRHYPQLATEFENLGAEQLVLQNTGYRFGPEQPLQYGIFSKPSTIFSGNLGTLTRPSRFYPTTIKGVSYKPPAYQNAPTEGVNLLGPNKLKKGGFVMDLTEKEIDQYIKEGYIIEEV